MSELNFNGVRPPTQTLVHQKRLADLSMSSRNFNNGSTLWKWYSNCKDFTSTCTNFNSSYRNPPKCWIVFPIFSSIAKIAQYKHDWADNGVVARPFKHPLCHDPRHDPGIITLLAVIKVRTSISWMCYKPGGKFTALSINGVIKILAHFLSRKRQNLRIY